MRTLSPIIFFLKKSYYNLVCEQGTTISYHCVKYRNFTYFPGVKILWEDTVSAEFRANRPKLYGNCAFLQDFHTSKLGEILLF